MADSAARAGYEVTSLDAFGDLDRSPGVTALSLPRDLGVSFSARAIAHASRSIACDAVAYLSPLENHPASVARMASGRALWGNDPSVLRRSRDPAVVGALNGKDRDAPSIDHARWLLKPRASGGGHGIRWWTPGEPVPRGAHVQQFVDGVPGSIVFVAANGTITPLGLTRQIVGDETYGASGFRYCGNVLGPTGDVQFDRDDELFDAACRLAERATRKLQLVGVNGIDFVATDGVPIAVEINPRWTASMELVDRAYGLSVFEAHVEACVSGELPTFDLRRRRTGTRAVGKAIVFARHDIVCDDTQSWLADADIRDVPHPGEQIASGRPVCTIFAEGGDSVACESALRRRAAALYSTLDQWSAVPT